MYQFAIDARKDVNYTDIQVGEEWPGALNVVRALVIRQEISYAR